MLIRDGIQKETKRNPTAPDTAKINTLTDAIDS